MSANNTIQSSALPVGYTLRDTYTIQSVLGQGGFGITYLAEENVTGRLVVIKENYPSAYSLRHTADQTVGADGVANLEHYNWALDSFLNEAKVLTQLKHPHIVPVLTSFRAQGTAYYVMDHINGTPLHECALADDRITEDRLLSILSKLLGALDYLHTQNLLHRDIKPDNILMTPEGEPILIDFGAARHIIATHTHSRVGTPGFSPPEQMSTNATPGPWTDLYSLAATCHYLITGRTPPNFTDRMFAAPGTTLLAPRSELHGRFSPALLSSIDRAFSLNHAERWQSAQEWLDALNSPDKTSTEPESITVTSPAPLTKLQFQQQLSRDEAHRLLQKQNIKPREYDYKLIACAEAGDTELVRLLIAAGADVNTMDKYGDTPLFLALHNGHTECVKLLLAAPGIDVNMADRDDRTPLFRAVMDGHTECVKLLLATPGIDVNKAAWQTFRSALFGRHYKRHLPPLSLAAEKGNTECVKLLLAAPGIDVNKADKDGRTPLQIAAEKGHTECVKLLLQAHGIDVNQNIHGKTPLTRAAQNGHTECVKLLLAAPGININEGAPLHLAAWSGHTECVKLMLAASGIDVNRVNDNGETPLHWAAYNGRTECVKLLLAAPGINVNKADKDGRTPLKTAEIHAHSKCVELLLAAGGKRNSLWGFFNNLFG